MATNTPRPLTDEIRAKGQCPVPPPPPPPSTMFRRSQDDVIQNLRDEIQRLQDVLRGYEKWEADLVLNGEWGSGQDGLPAMTYPQFDELMRLQSLRNEVLGK